MRATYLFSLAAFTFLCAHLPDASAYELYAEEGTALSAEFKAGYGVFTTRRNYVGRPGSFLWEEGFAKFGLVGQTDRLGAGTVYGALSSLTTATWGDGDPAGLTNGHERRTLLEDGYIGWRSADLFPALGTDGVDISAGSQPIIVGSGFLIKGDRLSVGKSVGNGEYDRGGAYYLSERSAFAHTAVLRLGGTEGLHGSAMWIRSNTHLVANTSMTVGTLDYTAQPGTLGLTYIHALDVDERYVTTPALLERRGMKIYSIRGEGNAGVPDANFAFEYAHQKRRETGSDNGWYAEAGYTFSEMTWRPQVSFRHARYSKRYDNFFQGPFGNRPLGEISANYSSSYGPNTRISDVAFTVQPHETLIASLMYFNYKTLENRSELTLDAQEAALYLDWMANKHLAFSSVIGVYKPRLYAGNGGNQSETAKPNSYVKLMVETNF